MKKRLVPATLLIGVAVSSGTAEKATPKAETFPENPRAVQPLNPYHWRLHLRDGSILFANITTEQINVATGGEDRQMIPLKRISSLENLADGTFHVLLPNGDHASGILRNKMLPVETLFGRFEMKLSDLLQAVRVVPGMVLGHPQELEGRDVVIGNMPGFKHLNEFTVSMQYKQSDTNRSGLFYLFQDKKNYIRAHFWDREWGTGRNRIMVHVVNGERFVGQAYLEKPLKDDQWVHLAVVYNGKAVANETALMAFLNGKPIRLTFDGWRPEKTGDLSQQDFRIGSPTVAGQGTIRDLKVYLRALTPEELKFLGRQ